METKHLQRTHMYPYVMYPGAFQSVSSQRQSGKMTFASTEPIGSAPDRVQIQMAEMQEMVVVLLFCMFCFGKNTVLVGFSIFFCLCCVSVYVHVFTVFRSLTRTGMCLVVEAMPSILSTALLHKISPSETLRRAWSLGLRWWMVHMWQRIMPSQRWISRATWGVATRSQIPNCRSNPSFSKKMPPYDSRTLMTRSSTRTLLRGQWNSTCWWVSGTGARTTASLAMEWVLLSVLPSRWSTRFPTPLKGDWQTAPILGWTKSRGRYHMDQG